jgi:hypothetical protein
VKGPAGTGAGETRRFAASKNTNAFNMLLCWNGSSLFTAWQAYVSQKVSQDIAHLTNYILLALISIAKSVILVALAQSS